MSLGSVGPSASLPAACLVPAALVWVLCGVVMPEMEVPDSEIKFPIRVNEGMVMLDGEWAGSAEDRGAVCSLEATESASVISSTAATGRVMFGMPISD